MSTFTFGMGGPRIKLLDAYGMEEATLYLPATNNGGITHTVVDNKQVDEMLDYSLNVTIRGYYHQFKCKWDIWDPYQTGRSIGIFTSMTPTLDQFVQILSSYRPGRLQFSPGPSGDEWYTVYVDKMPDIIPVMDYGTGVEVQFKTINLWSSADNSSGKVLV